jgi:hypothetical protein
VNLGILSIDSGQTDKAFGYFAEALSFPGAALPFNNTSARIQYIQDVGGRE